MVLSLKNVSKRYGEYIVFSDCDLSFDRYGLYYIKGISGSGKTTLLSIIGGYEDFDEGERVADNVSIAYIFQNFELIEELTVQENIELYEYLYHISHHQKQMIIDSLGLSSLLDHYPYELSHGQQQRVAIARTLLQNPDIILCDEPTESLDKKNKIIVMDLLKKLSENHIIIVVSHDEKLMENYYDYQYEIKNQRVEYITTKHIGNKVEKEQQNNPIFHYPSLRHLIKKMIIKKQSLYIISILILSTIVLIMFHIDWQLSGQNKGALNDNVIYTQSTFHQGNIYEIRPCFQFDKDIMIDDQVVHMNLSSIPSIHHDYPVLEGTFKENGIVVNQFAEEELKQKLNCDDVIGKEIILSFSMGTEYQHNFQLTITGVVKESDILGISNVYYPYGMIKSQLENDHVYTEYMQSYKQYYEIIYQLNEDTVALFNQVKNTTSINIFNQSLEILGLHCSQLNMLQFAFMIVVIILSIVLCLFLVIYATICYQKQTIHFAVIHTLGIPLKLIEKNYMMLNYIIMAIGLFLSVVLANILYYPSINFLKNLLRIELNQQKNLFIGNDILMIGILFVVYVISLFIIQRKEHKKSVTTLLKDGKDL